ncbi:MAG: ABC transporter substrate-binding protein, partial [Desulfobacula sp.]|nr:ABC transporter substrate-binding protein [Desulfobacula sp.]
MKIFFSLLSIFTLFLSAAYSEETKPIKIAVILSKTGVAATAHKRMLLTTKLSIEKINKSGGILGKKIKTFEIDNQSTPIGTKLAVQKAISENVTAVVGCSRSSNALVAGPMLNDAQIIMITPSATNPKVTLAGNYIFRVCFRDNVQGQIMANFAINDLKSKNAVVLTNTSHKYSIDLSQYFMKHYEILGGTIFWEGDFIDNMSDFSSILTKTKELNPDVIYLPAYVRDTRFIIKQARQMGIASIFLGCDAWGPKILEYAKDAVNGSYLTDHWHKDIDSHGSREFVKEFRKKYKITPGSASALTYDAINILANAIK